MVKGTTAERVFVVKVKLEVKLFGSSIRTHEDDRKRPPRRLAALHDDGEPVEQRHEDDGEVGAEADDVGRREQRARDLVGDLKRQFLVPFLFLIKELGTGRFPHRIQRALAVGIVVDERLEHDVNDVEDDCDGNVCHVQCGGETGLEPADSTIFICHRVTNSPRMEHPPFRCQHKHEVLEDCLERETFLTLTCSLENQSEA